MLASVATTMWWAIVILIPYVGVTVLDIWLAVVIPPRHHRSRWWTLAFLIPIVNFVAFFVYAYSLRTGESGHTSDASL